MTTLEEQIRQYIDALMEQEPNQSNRGEVRSTYRPAVLVIAGTAVFAFLAGVALLRQSDDVSGRLEVTSQEPPPEILTSSAPTIDQLVGRWHVLAFSRPTEGTGRPGESVVLIEAGPSNGQISVQVWPPCGGISAVFDVVDATLRLQPESFAELLPACPDDRLLSVFRHDVELTLVGEELVAVGSTGIEVRMSQG